MFYITAVIINQWHGVIIFLLFIYKCNIMLAMKNIGIAKLKEIAEKQGLTQSEIAKKIGITQGGLSHYFSGRRVKIDPYNAKKISEAFPSIAMEDFYRVSDDNGGAA